MKNIKKKSGQSLVEYIALTALVAIVSIGAVKVLGGKVHRRLNQITTRFDRSIQQGLKSKHSRKRQPEDHSEAEEDSKPSNNSLEIPW